MAMYHKLPMMEDPEETQDMLAWYNNEYKKVVTITLNVPASKMSTGFSLATPTA
jgi:hypothetical protein